MTKIAALYVQSNGCYYGLPDIDPWDEVREDDCATLRREGWTESAIYMLPEVQL